VGVPRQAWLLLGPPGSGKTPLGDALEAAGRGRHFDFGASLRAVGRGRPPAAALGAEGRAIVRDALRSGALLSSAQWFVAREVLASFLAGRRGRVVLNGLPRDVAQALAVEELVPVVRVVLLACEDATVRERLRIDAGGDRAGRSDDDPSTVSARLAQYRERTLPLIGHYRARGVPVTTLAVDSRTSAEDLLRALPVE